MEEEEYLVGAIVFSLSLSLSLSLSHWHAPVFNNGLSTQKVFLRGSPSYFNVRLTECVQSCLVFLGILGSDIRNDFCTVNASSIKMWYITLLHTHADICSTR